MTSTPSVVAGALQPYIWGRHNALLPFKPDAEHGPQAELWFGTHPAAMSEVLAGRPVSAGTSPLLMKILAAATPLSIQVHPGAHGIDQLLVSPATASLLSDTGIKDEALIAVEQFDVLAGFRDIDSCLQIFGAAGDRVQDVVESLHAGDRISAVRRLLTEPRNADLSAMCALMSDNEARIMRLVLEVYAADPAVLVSFMLQPRTLLPGEAMYVPAGCVHAYVNGLGIEVMTASDNVLRLGLTPKHIAVEPALSITDPDSQPVLGIASAVGFPDADAPFEVVAIVDSLVDIPTAGAVALAFDGCIVDVESGLTAHQGQAFLLHAGGHQLKVQGTGYLAWPRG